VHSALLMQVAPVGLDPSLLTVAVKTGGFEDRAGNIVNITPDATATVYYGESGRAGLVIVQKGGKMAAGSDHQGNPHIVGKRVTGVSCADLVTWNVALRCQTRI
jgi:hypothetical protein